MSETTRSESAVATIDMFPEAVLHPKDDTDERYTPRPFFMELHKEFNFTIDVCATKESAKLPRFWTKADNGLAQPWKGERVFCNPPYGDIAPWIRKAEAEHGAELVVMLLPSWTDREWWAELVEPIRDGRRKHHTCTLTTRFLRRRLAFGFPGNPEAVGVDLPNMWLVLLIWRPS